MRNRGILHSNLVLCWEFPDNMAVKEEPPFTAPTTADPYMVGLVRDTHVAMAAGNPGT